MVSFWLLSASIAGVNSDLPTRNEIQNRWDTQAKQKDLSPNEKQVQEDLGIILQFLNELEKLKQDSNRLKQQLAKAPSQLLKAKEGLNVFKNNTPDTLTPESLSQLPLQQLESRLNNTLNDLQSAQDNLSDYNSQLTALQTQPERVQSAMYAASQRLQQIRDQLNELTPGQDFLRPSQQQVLITEQALLNAKIEFQRQSLEANTTLQDLLQKQRDYTIAHIDRLERYVQLLQEEVSGKRLILS